MNAEQFAQAVELYVRDPAFTTTLKMLSDPPGRVPARGLVELSQWFARQNFEDRQRVEDVVRLSVDVAVHALLVALDGCSKLTKEAGDFELNFVTKIGERQFISGGRRCITSELYRFRFALDGRERAP